MKNWKILVLLFNLFLLAWVSFGYQQQWFSQYQEWADWISFSCQNQCVITLWQKDKIDYLDLNWNAKWNGIIAYWFLVWDQISLLNQYEVVVSADINDSMNFVEYKQYFSSIPWITDLILLVNGNLNWNIKIDSGKFSFGKKLSQWWKDFRTFDSFKPYTINLLYGPIVNWENFNKWFYVMFIILFIVLLFIKKDKRTKLKILLSWLLILWCIYDIRMWLEWINYYREDYKNYISQGTYQKVYRDRWDFYSFVDFVQNQLKLEWVKNFEEIWFFTDNTRPFPGSMKYFLYPYRIRNNQDIWKYILVYQSSKVKIIDNNSIEIDNDKITGKIIKFQDYAFIFIKNK